MRQISKDPFTGETIYRDIIYVGESDEGCDNCGNLKFTPNDRLYLYQYYSEPDSLRGSKHKIVGDFCCIKCMREFHGGHY